MGKSTAIIAFVLLLPAILLAQAEENSSPPPFTFSTNTNYGFLISHRPSMKSLIKGHTKAIELNFEQPTFGKKPWHSSYNYPSWGASFLYLDFGNPEELGTATACYAFFQFPIKETNRLKVLYKIGTGIGYISKPFDLEKNYKNVVIGSRFNGAVTMQGNIEYKLNERVLTRGGLSLVHFSNGSCQQPNLGINIAALSAGLGYTFGNVNKERATNAAIEQTYKYKLTLNGTFTYTDILKGYPKKFLVFGTYLEGTKSISQKSRLGATADIFYNTGVEEKMEIDSITIKSPFQTWQTGAFLSYQIQVWRITMLAGMGAYIYSPYKGDGLFYHRIGTRFHVSKKLHLNLVLKSHFFKAEYFEWGLGIKLWDK